MDDNRQHNSILILTDFGSCSRNAADYGLQLAKKVHANITLFYSYYVPVFSMDNWNDATYPALKEKGVFKLEEEAERLKISSANLEGSFNPAIDCVVEGGAIADNVSNLINERENILMVVMGGYKARNNDDFQSGTAIKDVLGQVRCPVVIVPEFEFKL